MPQMPQTPERELTLSQRLLYAAGELGVNLAPSVVAGWLLYFYTGRADGAGEKIHLVGLGVFAAITFCGRLVDALADPFIGYLSDRTRTRWGRRRPWIFLGAPFFTLFSLLIWRPPGAPESWINAVWLAVALGGFWFFFTTVTAPYAALLPEITRHRGERVEISGYMAINDALGVIAATVGIGLLVKHFPDGATFGDVRFRDGYTLAAWLVAAPTLFFFWLAVSRIRERPMTEAEHAPHPFRTAIALCFRNPSYPPYAVSIACFRMTINTLMAGIPFIVTQLIGMKEDVAGYLQGAVILLALPCFVLVHRWSMRWGKRRVFLIAQIFMGTLLPLLATLYHAPFLGHLINFLCGGTLTIGAVRLIHTSLLFSLAVFPVAVFLVLPRPILSDAIDLDTQHTGRRREAIYFGMEGLIAKTAAGLSTLLLPLLLKYFGDSAARPWGILLIGPVLGVFLLAGAFVFRKFPIRD